MRIKLLLTSFLLLSLIGCSRFEAPQAPAFAPDRAPEGHALFGVWRLDFDPAGPSARALPARSAALHVDVTPFLVPPKCPDCLLLVVTDFSPGDGILDLEASIRNPTAWTGYDVRAILRWETEHIRLANADDYTALFDDGGAKTINPFIAYAVELDERDFQALAVHTRPINFRFDELGHFREITFVVEAGYPGHCEEPYQIANQAAAGHLVGTSPVIVQCDVFDWQNDVTGVELDPGPLGTGPIALTHSSGTLWTGTVANLTGAAPGEYPLFIRAISPGGMTDSLYDYLNVTVSDASETGLDSGPWPMLAHDAPHTARSPYNGPIDEPQLVWDSFLNGVSWGVNYAGASLSASGRLYVASGSGVYCLDLAGNQVWHESAPFDNVHPPPQPLLTASGAVIVCYSSLETNSDPQGIYAYNAATGDLLWSTTTISYWGSPTPKVFSVYDSPVLTEDGLLVAVAREHVIVALNASNGAQQWLWPDDVSQYRSILPGSYLDAWRGAPALSSEGLIVAVADWFENPRLIVLTEIGSQTADVPLTTLTAVNCHPLVTDDDVIVLSGYVYNIVETNAAVEAHNIYGTFLWSYTDDVIRVLQSVGGIGPDGTLYFLDGTGISDTFPPYDYHTYLLALNPSGSFAWRKPVFSRGSAATAGVRHFRSGVTVGNDGTVYAAACWRHGALAVNYISGVAAMDPNGDVLWTYGVEENVPFSSSYYGTPTIALDGTLYVARYDRLQALREP